MTRRQSRSAPDSPAQWTAVAVQFWTLWAEANTVIALRMFRMMSGGRGAKYESETMVSEKLSALHETAMDMVFKPQKSGTAFARQMMAPSSRRVRANRKRLSK